MATVTKQARKKIWAFLALGTFVGLLLLPLFLSLPAGAGDTPAPAASTDAKPVEKSRDVWYKTEGPVIGAPAPRRPTARRTTRGTTLRAGSYFGWPFSNISIMEVLCWQSRFSA